MPRTPAEILRYSRTEAWIERLLFTYPELLAPGLPPPQKQVTLSPECRADLLFVDEAETILVEIKRGVIDLAALEQVRRYRPLLKMKWPGRRFRAYLIGAALSKDAARSLARSGGTLQYRQIGLHIPKEILLCRQCRHARDARLPVCGECGDKQVT